MKIEVNKIGFPKNPLRRVDQNSEDYLSLRESIRKEGLLQDISVFKVEDDRYELIDGGHRLQAHKDLGKREIDAKLMVIRPQDSLKHQIIHNAHRIEVKPTENAVAIKKLLEESELTQEQLSLELRISQGWISRNLFLADCESEKIKGYINKKQMCISNAMLLMSLPKLHQEPLAKIACIWNVRDFRDLVQKITRARIADIRQAKNYISSLVRAEKKYRGDSIILAEIENMNAFEDLKKREEFNSLETAWKQALKWCIHQDELGKEELLIKTNNEFRKKLFKET